MNRPPDFGNLLSEPDLRDLKKIFLIISPVFVSLGVVLLVISMLPFKFEDPIDIQIIRIMPAVLGATIIGVGFMLLTRSFKVKLQLFEHGFVDYYYGSGEKRENPVESYFLKNEVIYGKKGINRREIIIKRVGICPEIFDNVIEDLEIKNQIVKQ